MSVKSFIEQARSNGKIIDVRRFDGTNSLGRGEALTLDGLTTLGEGGKTIPTRPSAGTAVMLTDCGSPKDTLVAAGSIIRFWDRPGYGFVISEATDLLGRMTFKMPEMSHEELERELDAMLIEDDLVSRTKNIERAENAGWQFQEGIGWVDRDGRNILDELGRPM